MSKYTAQEHREKVLVILAELKADCKYIKEKVDRNEKYLDKLNGRVSETERRLNVLQGIGIVIGTIFSITFGWLIKRT